MAVVTALAVSVLSWSVATGVAHECPRAARRCRSRSVVAEDGWEDDDYHNADEALKRYQAYGFFDEAGRPVKKRVGLLDQQNARRAGAEDDDEDDDDGMTTERMLVPPPPAARHPPPSARCPPHIAGHRGVARALAAAAWQRDPASQCPQTTSNALSAHAWQELSRRQLRKVGAAGEAAAARASGQTAGADGAADAEEGELSYMEKLMRDWGAGI